MEDLTRKDMCMDWDSVIESDGNEFILLREGDYPFIVTNFERGRFPGGEKLPSCNKATITVKVKCEAGYASVRFDLMLHKALEWKLAGFFRCIGQKEKGKQLHMDWSTVVGSKGYAHFKVRSYTNKNGDEVQINDLGKFYDYNEDNFKGNNPDNWGNEFTEVEVSEDDLPF